MRFQSTRPIRGATSVSAASSAAARISIHAPHTGRDVSESWQQIIDDLFQSTRPIRGATGRASAIRSGTIYFNPRAPYGARPNEARPRYKYGRISIHAPHTGRDVTEFFINIKSLRISIHAPHTGRDSRLSHIRLTSSIFQSTRPIRGATFCGLPCPLEQVYFNPRAPYGARHQPFEQPTFE